jgi:predicted outer membrane repeat protein
MKTIIFKLVTVIMVWFFNNTIQASDTIISDTTWTSNIVITENILISSGATLTIDSGITVYFLGYFKIEVQGRMLALGTNEEKIIFTSCNASQPWNGLVFDVAPFSGNDTSKLVNCLFRYGSATGSGDDSNGGSIFVYVNSPIQILSCEFQYNHAVNDGGAIYSNFADIRIVNSVFKGNSAGRDGGAIYCYLGTDNILINSILENNTAGRDGGAIYTSNGGGIDISNSLFRNNTGYNGGGAISCYGLSGASIIRCVFDSNYANALGGAITCNMSTIIILNSLIHNNFGGKGGGINITDNGWGYTELTNNTICNNQSGDGGALYFENSSGAFRNNILYGNTDWWYDSTQIYLYDDSSDPDFYYCDIQGGIGAFKGSGAGANYNGDYENCIDADPQFTGSGEHPYDLSETSPCINTGDPSTTNFGQYDLAGDPRFSYGIIDIGAYEMFILPDNFPGTSLDFDGTNDYVEVSDVPSLDLTTNYTIEAWIKPESFSGLAGIVTKYHTNGSDGYLLRLHSVDPFTGLCFDEMYTSAGILEAGTLYHIAAVNDTGTRKLYLNGVEQTLTGTPLTVQANSDPLCIGVDYLTSGRYFDGKIEEVRIWNIALDSTQLRENMYRTLTGNETGLVAYWQFNEGTGTSLFDVVGWNLGTLTNMDEEDWVTSTAPLPFVTASDGTWESNGTWLPGQNAPILPWSRAKIKHNITLNSNMELLELIIDTNAIMTISTGDTLTVGGE